jgi:hypothetical protein
VLPGGDHHFVEIVGGNASGMNLDGGGAKEGKAGAWKTEWHEYFFRHGFGIGESDGTTA